MKKIMRLVPFFLFLSIFLWGFVNVNLQNTTVFNNDYIVEEEPSVKSSEEILDNIGIDLSGFNEDKSIIKIYGENNILKVVINKKTINLNELIIGKGILLVINSIDNILGYFNDFINNAVQGGI